MPVASDCVKENIRPNANIARRNKRVKPPFKGRQDVKLKEVKPPLKTREVKPKPYKFKTPPKVKLGDLTHMTDKKILVTDQIYHTKCSNCTQ